MNTPPAPQHRLADLRDWLMDRIDGSEEMRGEDGLISDFIRQIDALPSEMGAIGLEPRGCPTPGSCSAVAELADLKQRLLPQFAGRAERAERENADLRHDIERLTESLTAEVNKAPSATAAPPVEETAIGHARYEYLRTLNPRQFAALYDEALHGTADNFDDLVDRYRDAKQP